MSILRIAILLSLLFNSPVINANHRTLINTKSPNVISKNDSDAYAQNVHMYICIQALQLLKDKFPSTNFSVLENRIGTMNDYGDRPWQLGKITTGATREDMEDVVYNIRGPFNFWATTTHFWNADDRLNGDYSLTNLNIGGTNYPFPNSFMKVKKFMDGQWFIWNDNGYGGRQFIEYNDGSGYLYRFSYHTRGLIGFYKTNKIWLESKINILGQVEYIREEVTVSNYIRDIIFWEVVGRVAHHLEDNTVPAHTHNDLHGVPVIGDECYHEYIDNGAYQDFNWITAKNAGGFIQPYGVDNDPLRYLMYTANQLADHYPSGPDCLEIPQQHFGDNNLPGGSYPMLIDYYHQLGPVPSNITDLHAEASYCFNHAIRSTAALLYWIAVEAGIVSADPLAYPRITSFSKNLPDNYLLRGETLTLTCNATGSQLEYEWFIKVCDTNNTCMLPIEGLSLTKQGNRFNISNINFRNSWTCDHYDTLCTLKGGIDMVAPPPLNFFVGVKVKNQFGYTSKYFYINQAERFNPLEALRPPVEISGCLFLLTNDGSQYQYDNNVLYSGQHTKNKNKDTYDKYLLRKNISTDQDGIIKLALKEISIDKNFIDNVKLLSVDHPENSLLGITSNDIVMYFPEEGVSPVNASISGKDVTKEIQADTLFSKIQGNKNEELYMKFPAYNFSKKSFDKINDSVAFIFDPHHHTIKPDPIEVKDVTGILTSEDSQGNVTHEKDLAIRQLESVEIIPIFKNTALSNINILWKRGFEMSYGYVSNIYY
ncbi:MAG: hypothetical protein ABI840_13225, partial [bacterium]